MSSNSAISFPNMQPPGGENALQGIFNNDQGLFQNHGSKKITNIPTLDLAYLTNDNSQNEIDNTINLNPSYLTWNDFITLFYSTTTSGFCISATNANAAPISLFGQTYTTTQNHKSTFSLSQQIIKAWAKKNNKPESSVPIPFRIQLERQNFLTKTLSYVNGFQLGLSLDEVISTLLSQQEIQPADYESYATVQFTINYRDYFCPLDTSLLVVFTFITNIPGYTNGNNPNPPYSNDSNNTARSVFVPPDENESVYSYEGSNTFYNDDNTQAQNTIIGFTSNNSVSHSQAPIDMNMSQNDSVSLPSVSSASSAPSMSSASSAPSVSSGVSVSSASSASSAPSESSESMGDEPNATVVSGFFTQHDLSNASTSSFSFGSDNSASVGGELWR